MVEKFFRKVEEGISNLRNPGRQAAPPIDISPQTPQVTASTQITEVLETIGIPGGEVKIVRDGKENIMMQFVPSITAFRLKNSEDEENPWNFTVDMLL